MQMSEALSHQCWGCGKIRLLRESFLVELASPVHSSYLKTQPWGYHKNTPGWVGVSCKGIGEGLGFSCVDLHPLELVLTPTSSITLALTGAGSFIPIPFYPLLVWSLTRSFPLSQLTLSPVLSLCILVPVLQPFLSESL